MIISNNFIFEVRKINITIELSVLCYLNLTKIDLDNL